MNSKQRILTALGRKQPDKVPVFEAWINESSIVNLAKLLIPEASHIEPAKDKLGEERFEILDLLSLVIKELDLDGICYTFSMGGEPIKKNHVQDKYGTVYRLSEHGEPIPVEGPIKDPSDIKGFDVASRLEPDDFAGFRYLIDKVGRNRALFMIITDPFKLSWLWRGAMQNLLVDYVLSPQLVHDLGRISSDFYMAAIDMAFEVRASAIFMNGDLAGEKTTIMSPEHYREYIKPYQKRVVEYAHRKGMKIVKHSDGNLWPILDDLLEVGFDGIHPVQPQCMDIGKVKEHLAGRMCILGNIDCRNLLPFGTEEEVRKSVRQTIEKVAPGGGYIISSSNTIHPGCRPENYIAMVQAAHRYGRYNA